MSHSRAAGLLRVGAAALGGGLMVGVALIWPGIDDDKGDPEAPVIIFAHDPANPVTAHDPDRTDDGYIIVSPFTHREADVGLGMTYLVDRSGNVVHAWRAPSPLGGHVQMTPEGDLWFLGKSPENVAKSVRMPGGGEAGILYQLGWNGEVLWQFEDNYMHHDFDLLPDGSVAALRWAPLPDDVAARVGGGMPDTLHEGKMWGDEIIEVSRAGEVTVVWSAADWLDPADWPLPDFARRAEWTHANSLRYLPANPVTGSEAYLLSFRELSLVLMVDRSSGQILWRYGGPGVLNQQHDPMLTSSGTILIFDNGQYRYGSLSSSRVVEVDPARNEVVWTYLGEGIGGWRFYSPATGGAQRLSNGNTLVTEAFPGRIFEVTAEAEVVWEFYHPFGGVDPTSRSVNTILFKSRFYPAEDVRPLLSR